MQLTIISLLLCLFLFAQEVKAQLRNLPFFPPTDNKKKGTQIELDSTTYDPSPPDAIELDLLTSYYAQDGNNGAVQGGIGTEQLTDYASKVSLKIPMTEKLGLNFDAGFDYYSSASTELIDNVFSGESSSDMRVHGNVGFSYKLTDQQTFGLRIGGSTEYDYNSLNAGFNYGWESKDRNTTIGLNGQVFSDRWGIIYPTELRREGPHVSTDKRQSYNGSLTISRIINKRMQASVQLEGIYMKGLLSTPFHRVFFQEQEQAKVEQLPGKRLKTPIGVRFNYHVTDFLIAKLYYRYYWDDWGVQGHTASVELPFKLSRFLSVYPFYRYHTQTAADYFQPYKEHTLDQEFYTSDYDLSELQSHTYGAGIRYSPVNGLARMKTPFKKRPIFMLKSIDIKYSHYDRSTGLKANIISAGLSFSF
ncbi:MAG: DUF3570 domain-containing protein [Bacteroidota bacterium]